MLGLVKNSLRYHTFGKMFYIAVAGLLFYGVVDVMHDSDVCSMLTFGYGLPFVCAVVIINTGREHSCGGLRLKTVAGYSKVQIYLAQMISSMICAAILYLFIAVPIFLDMAAEHTALYFMTLLLTYMFAGAVSACLAMCISRTVIVMCGVMAAGVMMFVMTEPLQEALQEEKYNVSYTIDYSRLEEYGVDGCYAAHTRDNPSYIGGAGRVIFKVIAAADPWMHMENMVDYMDMLEEDKEYYKYAYVDPAAGVYTDLECDMHKEEISEKKYMFVYTIGLIAAVTAAGLIGFRRKELV